MTSPSRRQLLAAIGTASVAGCLSLGGDGNGGQSRLNEVTLSNGAEGPRTVDIRVTWDGEVVHDRSYELAAEQPDADTPSRMVAEQTWPDEPGRFLVEARVRGKEWLELDPASWDYPDCFTVFGSVEGDRNVMLLWSDDQQYCSEPEQA
ncbi:hypothetical protein GCM10028857_23600 [Salinarchaeum chitinilyticum]